VPAVAAACADEVTQRWLPLPRPYDEEMAARWCSGIAENLRVTGDGIQLAVVDRNSDRLVGGIGLKRTSIRSSERT
jgi:hypothetical protein